MPLYYKPFISKALIYGPCLTMGSRSFICHPHMNHTCLYSPSASITAVWLVLIVPTYEGMTRLSWPVLVLTGPR